ncbi:MAG: baseplate J/gp47 family protein [Myxococcales bacterium]|nr:baseplate J/gp47 family protein [Myxococcales bacterium]
MSHELPGVPELRYADLVDAAKAKIPALAPEWTDHGPADAGVALIELLAWVTEILGYRATRQTDAMTRAFLELLGGAEAASADDVHTALQQTLEELWTRYRAASPDDFVHLAMDEFPTSPEGRPLKGQAALHQVVCLNTSPGRVKLVIVPKDRIWAGNGLLRAIERFFEPRRLLTTRVEVSQPRKIYVPVQVEVYLDDGAVPAAMRQRIYAVIDNYFSPYTGGGDGGGLRIGGEVYVSDFYRLIDSIDGVDFVAKVNVTDDNNRKLVNDRGEITGLAIRAHELAVHGYKRTEIRLFEPLSGGGWEEVPQ